MGKTIASSYSFISCDQGSCENETPRTYGVNHQIDSGKEAEAKGWYKSTTTGRWTCPECRKKGK